MTKRRRFSAGQKAVIVRRHLGGKELVSDLADELGLQPSQIDLWAKQVLEQAARAFPLGRLRGHHLTCMVSSSIEKGVQSHEEM